MTLQKELKKKWVAEDYAFLGGVLLFGIPVLMLIILFLVVYIRSKHWSAGYTGNLFSDIYFIVRLISIFLGIIWILAIPVCIVAGFIALKKSIKEQAKFKNQLNASAGILLGIVAIAVLPVAIPAFFRFGTHDNQSEVKQNLYAIYTAYTSYNSDHSTYPSSYSIQVGNTVYNCLTIADWEPKGNIRYNYNCMNSAVFQPDVKNSPCPYRIVTNATKDSFTVAACGTIDNDATVDVWTIDDAKHLRNVMDDVRN